MHLIYWTQVVTSLGVWELDNKHIQHKHNKYLLPARETNDEELKETTEYTRLNKTTAKVIFLKTKSEIS